MSTQTNRAKSLIDDMLKVCAEDLERRMRQMIQNQSDFYEETKKTTIGRMLGQVESNFNLTQHFRYQETCGATLREMERTFFEYFGKPWNFVEPPVVTPDEVTLPKGKRGRPSKK